MSVRVLACAMLAACTPTRLLSATTTYATHTQRALFDVAASGDLIASVCHERAQIEYLTSAISAAPDDYERFFAEHVAEGGGTWRQQCEAYRAGDDAFTGYVHVVAAYAQSLGAFAADDADAGAPLGALVNAAGGELATDVAALAPYRSALSGIGDPLGKIAHEAQAHWKAKHLGNLIRDTDKDLEVVVKKLDAYLTTVRTGVIDESRRALRDLLAGVDALQTPAPVAHHVVRAFIEVEIESRLRVLERRVETLRDLLAQVLAAHHELADGWSRGECAGADTLRRMRALGDRIADDVARFEIPVTGGGS